MIQTVTGICNKEELGVSLSHEHIFIDMKKCVDKPEKADDVFFSPFDNTLRYRIYKDPYGVLDNALTDDLSVALKELEIFKSFGGQSIVDCTTDEIGRSPEKLKTLSSESGVKIIMGCGHYYEKSHGEYVKRAKINDLADGIIKDIVYGVSDTGIKAGVIGEIGTSAVITENELKVLHAAGIAGKETGKAIHIHTDLYTENGYRIVKILTEHGVSPEKICIDHIDVNLRPKYISDLLEMGVYVEFDNFGKEFYVNKEKRFAYDLERVKVLSEMAEKGYLDKILICNDICLKSMLCSYGGNGYGHVLNTVKDMLIDNGLGEKEFEKIVTENVWNFLDGKFAR